MARFTWTSERIKAAGLVAQANLTRQEIASSVGVTKTTLQNWLNIPEFRARVDEHNAEIAAEVRRIGIATVTNRVHALNSRWIAMKRVIHERAESPEMKDVPGGTTGLLAKTVKGIGRGDDFQVIELFEVDTGLLREMREHEKQAAQELGQWVERVKDETPKDATKEVLPEVAAAGIAGALAKHDEITAQGASTDDADD